MIKIKNLNYKNILHDINIDLEKGVTYIKGDNGAGKSTFLDCLSGLNENYSGEIITNEKIIYLNQNLYFSPRLSCKDFVEFTLLLDNIKDFKNVFFNYVSSFSQNNLFEKIWKTPIGKISGGERAKLFFSTFACIDRDWYIFDEPFSGVDSSGKEFMIDVIKNLEKNGKGIIITSHETDPLRNLEKINLLEIKNGKIYFINGEF